jgi:hypothetical protein
MTLSFPETMLHWTILLLVNNKLERLWKEVVMLKYKLLSGYFVSRIQTLEASRIGLPWLPSLNRRSAF